MEDLISVIIPTFQRPEMLREAILSVKAQVYSNIEIIVVDDHSGDNTASITDEFPEVHYFENSKNCGPGFSRKYGLSKSHGKYVVFLDDDDYYTDCSFFRHAVELFHTGEDYVFVASAAKAVNQITNQYEDCVLNVQGEMDALEYLSGFSFCYDVPCAFSIIFSREYLKACGVFDMDMVNHMPMIMRCLQSGKVFFMSDAVGVYRKHDSNISNAITAAFLIDNLKEKNKTLEIIKTKRLFQNYNEWWLEQVKTTVGYYVYGSQPQLAEVRKVKQWCIAHSENRNEIAMLFLKYCNYLIDCRICKLKSNIKKVLGMK